MPRDNDSFWIAIFRKNPLIASCMALGGLLGVGVGYYFFHPLVTGDPRYVTVRPILCILFSFFCGGTFLGLIIGVIVDSLIGAVRDRDNKKKR